MKDSTKNMLRSVGGAVASGGLGLLDGFLTRRYNERMMERQNRMNIDQWNRENAYNHPAAVTARLKEAGINPALAYMNGASFAPAASSPQLESPNAKSFGLQMDPMTASSVRLQNAQADLLQSQKETEDKTRSGKIRELEANIGNLESNSGLAQSTAVLNEALTGKAKQEQENLKQQWQQSNSRFEYDLEILKSNAKISKETALRTARSLEAAISQAESLAKYNAVQAQYHPQVVAAAVAQAEAAVTNAVTNSNQYFLDRDKWFGVTTPDGAKHAGQSQAVQASAELQLAQLRTEISRYILNMQESDLFDETELARIIQQYTDIVKK